MKKAIWFSDELPTNIQYDKAATQGYVFILDQGRGQNISRWMESPREMSLESDTTEQRLQSKKYNALVDLVMHYNADSIFGLLSTPLKRKTKSYVCDDGHLAQIIPFYSWSKNAWECHHYFPLFVCSSAKYPDSYMDSPIMFYGGKHKD